MSNLVALGSVAEINPRLPRGIDESQQVSFLSMASVSEDGRILGEETRILGETKKGYTYFEHGDVLIAKITPCFENGKAALVDQLKHQVGFGSTEFHVIRVHSDKLDARYLFYLVWSDLFRFYGGKSMTGAAGQKRVSSDFLKTFEIPLPPLPEQRRIAAILDKADAIRRKRQEAIRLTDDFLRSVFLDMFGDPVTNPKGWEVEKLGAITKFENGDRSKNYPSGDEIKSEGVLFLSTKNIVDGKLNLRNPQFITKEKYQSLSQGKAKPLDLLITLRGTLGNCCVFNSMFDRAFINAQMMIIRPSEKCKVDFLHSFMTSVSIRDFFQKIGQGAAVPQLTATQLRAIDVPLPPVDLQQRFSEIKARVVGVLETMVEFSNSRLFDSLVQRAFRGDL